MARAALPDFPMYIGGRRVTAVSGEWMESLDPYTGEPWARAPRGGAEDVALAIDAADAAFRAGAWAALPASDRAATLRRFAELIALRADELALLETRDNGKLLTEMQAQLRYLPQWFHYYAGLADKLEGATPPVERPDVLGFTLREPLGVVAAITPWNSPLLLAGWKLAPALAAGNTVVLKPSEHASISSLALMELVEEAGFPPGVLNVVTGLGHEAGAALAADPRVRKVAFTGGEAGAVQVCRAAAEDFKSVTLELGASRPTSSSPTPIPSAPPRA